MEPLKLASGFADCCDKCCKKNSAIVLHLPKCFITRGTHLDTYPPGTSSDSQTDTQARVSSENLCPVLIQHVTLRDLDLFGAGAQVLCCLPYQQVKSSHSLLKIFGWRLFFVWGFPFLCMIGVDHVTVALS